MGVTRLNRKDRRNKSKAKNRIKGIKQLTAKPVIKNVDIEEIKAGFAKSEKPKAAPAKAKAAEATTEEAAKPAKAKKAAEKPEKEEKAEKAPAKAKAEKAEKKEAPSKDTKSEE